MSRACFIAVVLEEGSSVGSEVEAYVGRLARRTSARLAASDAPELGAAFIADAAYTAIVCEGGDPAPAPETVRSIVRALLQASDVAAVRVGWWQLGARRVGARHVQRIEIGGLDSVDWQDRFTIEVRRAPAEGFGPTLREIALGIA